MLDTLVHLFTQYGYHAVFITLMICGFGLPVPEDITLAAGGVIAGLGYANEHVMVAVGIGGVLAGDTLMFVLGRIYGERLLRFRYVAMLLTPQRYALVQAKFARYGNRLMFVARFLPGLRSPIYLTAGMTRRVSFIRFFLMDSAAAALSVPIWVYLGYYGAANHEWLLRWLGRGKAIIGLFTLIVIALASVWIWRRWRRRRDVLGRRQQQLDSRAQRNE